MPTTSHSNHPESDALWQPGPLAVPSPHYTYTFADNYREDEYKFACRMEEKYREAVAYKYEIKSDYSLCLLLLGGLVNRLSNEKVKPTNKEEVPHAVDMVLIEKKQLTLERDSLREQLEAANNDRDNLHAQWYAVKEGRDSLIAQMAVMVGALSPFLKEEYWSDISGQTLLRDNKVVKEALDNTPLAAKDLHERVERMEKACELSLAEFRALTGYLHSHNMISPQTRMVINLLKEVLSDIKQPAKG